MGPPVVVCVFVRVNVNSTSLPKVKRSLHLSIILRHLYTECDVEVIEDLILVVFA